MTTAGLAEWLWAPGARFLRARSSARLDRSISLLWALVTREWKGRYRRTLLGPAWAVLQPLMYMVLFTFIRGLLSIPSDGLNYMIFSYSALVPWTFFSGAVGRCGPSVTGNAALVKKIAIARDVFPIAGVVSALADLLFAMLVLLGMMVWFQVPVGWSLIWFPVLVLLAALLATGVGFGIAAIGTFKRDIIFAIPFLMQFWMLATPIMYPLSSVPDRWQLVYRLNPMVGIIEGFRSVMVRSTAPDVALLGFTVAGIFLIWLVAWPMFRYASQYFADVL